MKLLFIFMIAVFLTEAQAKVQGSEGVGGGDLCENRIKIVRDDLKSWILSGGSAGLKLPEEVTLSEYNSSMLEQLDNAVIRCVSEGDVGFPVQIDNIPKVCRFNKFQGKSFLTCDYQKFQLIAQADQYVLIHHEYAGLADIENPKGADSNYSLSNQLSGYLINQVVKKLSIVPNKDREFSIEREFRVDRNSPIYKGYALAVGIPGQLIDFDKFDNESIGNKVLIEKKFKNFLVDIHKNKIVAVMDRFSKLSEGYDSFIKTKYELIQLPINDVPVNFMPMALISHQKNLGRIEKIFLLNESSKGSKSVVLKTDEFHKSIREQVEILISKKNLSMYKNGNQVSIKVDNTSTSVGDPSYIKLYTVHTDHKNTDDALHLNILLKFSFNGEKIIPKVYSVTESN